MKVPWRPLGRFAERTLAVTGAFFILFHVFFEASTFTTGSMAPLLNGAEEGSPDSALIEKRLTRNRAPSRFQVVAFTNDDGIDVAKRVVALPGETIRIEKDRSLWINGARIATPAGIGRGKGYLAAGNLYDGRAITVPENCVYVLGDDTQDSVDSRFTGPLRISRIRGRVIARIFPLDRLKWLG